MLQQISKNVVSAKETTKNSSELYWFIFYTFPRAEKVVYHELMNRNYDVFLPMTKTLSVWKNRQKKWIDQILFPSYIFVHTYHCELYHIIRIPKIVTCVQCAGNPSIIPTEEIEGIKRMLCLDQKVYVETKYYKGDKVKIVCGPLVGHEGILVRQNGKTRLGIQLKEISHMVLIDINIKDLEKV